MDGNIEDISQEDMMREFMTITSPTIKPNELTVKGFMQNMEANKKRAQYVLDKYVALKILKVRKVIIDGASVNAYSPMEGTWKDVVDKIKPQE